MNKKSLEILKFIDKHSLCSYNLLKKLFDVDDTNYPYYAILFDKHLIDGHSEYDDVKLFLTPKGEELLQKIKNKHLRKLEERIWKVLTLVVSIIAIIVSITK